MHVQYQDPAIVHFITYCFDISKCHQEEAYSHRGHFELSLTGVTNNANDGRIPFVCFTSRVLQLRVVFHLYDLLLQIKVKEPLCCKVT